MNYSNALLVYPLHLFNSVKRNIVIRVTLRHGCISSENDSEITLSPPIAALQNNRRGPRLASYAYSSCNYHSINPSFLDEFIFSLPNTLDPHLCLVAEVYHVRVKDTVKRWRGGKKTSHQPATVASGSFGALSSDETLSQNSSMEGQDLVEPQEQEIPMPEPLVEFQGLGILPLIPSKSLLSDNLHSISISYQRSPQPATERGATVSGDNAVGSAGLESSARAPTPPNISLPVSEYPPSFASSSASMKVYRHSNLTAMPLLKLKTFSMSSLHAQHDNLQAAYRLHPVSPMMSTQTFSHSYVHTSRQTLDLVKALIGICDVPSSIVSSHLPRILKLCTLCFTSGHGTYSSSFADPTNTNALRINAFAVFLVAISKVSTLYLRSVNDVCGILGEPWSIKHFSSIVAGLCADDYTTEDDESCDAPETPRVECEPVDATPPTPRIRCNTYPPDDVSTPSSASSCESKETCDTVSPTSPPQAKVLPVITRASSPRGFYTMGAFMQAELSTIKETEEDNSVSLSKSFENGELTIGLTATDKATDDSSRTSSPASSLQVRTLSDADLGDPKTSAVPSEKLRKSVPPRTTNELGFLTASSTLTSGLASPNSSIIESTEGFLDKIGANLGYSNVNSANDDIGGENKSVGVKHHRKTQSVCSIDWSLAGSSSITSLGQKGGSINQNIGSGTISSSSSSDSTGSLTSPVKHSRKKNNGGGFLSAFINAVNTMSPNSITSESPPESETCPPSHRPHVTLPVPSTSPRQTPPSNGKWWPYLYEVIICQWAILLQNQQKLIESSEVSDPGIHSACVISKGVTVSMAPVLFDVIKHSLCLNITELTRKESGKSANPLVTLDSFILESLGSLVRSLADACVATRNFDKVSSRRIAREVNSSLLQFIRDLFSFFPPSEVQILINIYFSAFLKPRSRSHKEGVSKLSVRYSTEVLNLRLDAVKILTNTKHFVEVNTPVANTWEPKYALGEDTGTSVSNRHPKTKAKRRLFFTKALSNICKLMSKPTYRIARGSTGLSQPHWLASIVVDQCLHTASQPDFEIQARAAEILLELFQSHSQEGTINQTRSKIIAMYVPMIKMLCTHVQSLLLDDVRSSRRKKMLSSLLLILQSAPPELLTALWRELIISCKNCGRYEFPGVELARNTKGNETEGGLNNSNDSFDSSLLLFFDLLILSLRTLEYIPQDTLSLGGSNRSQHESAQSQHNMWFSHDATSIVVSTARAVVSEMIFLIKPDAERSPTCNMSDQHLIHLHLNIPASDSELQYSVADMAMFVRSVSTVYLNGLSLNQSDSATIGLISASVELLKAFGLKLFLVALGDTLQDWLRVLLLHSGARKANIRVQTLEFLVLLLRACWSVYGTLSKIRMPCLAVMVEVMDKLSTRNGQPGGKSNVMLSLSPLAKSLERLEQSSVSKNLAFKAALTSFAGQLQTLYRAYIAVTEMTENTNGSHSESIEEALMNATKVFDKNELPFYRIVWLRKLSEFHELPSRQRFAESALCRFEIYKTYESVVAIVSRLWHPRPFPLWEELSRRRRGEGSLYSTGGIPEAPSNLSEDTFNSDAGTHKMSRFLYQVASEDIENSLVVSLLKAAEMFKRANMYQNSRTAYSLAAKFFASKFDDEGMQQSYLALAMLIKVSVPRLDAVCYENPKMASITGVNLNPIAFQPSEYGRFFRVWFHGSAPDHLVGEEFVYRAPHNTSIEGFGDHVSRVIEAQLPPYVPIDLILDDGLHGAGETARKTGAYVARPSQRRVNMKKVVLERAERDNKGLDGGVCQIKITPLRPVRSYQEVSDGAGVFNAVKGTIAWFEMMSAIGWSPQARNMAVPESVSSCTTATGDSAMPDGPRVRTGSIASMSGSVCGSTRSDGQTKMSAWSGANSSPSKAPAGGSFVDMCFINKSDGGGGVGNISIEGLTTFEFIVPKTSNDATFSRNSSLGSDPRKVGCKKRRRCMRANVC